MVASIPPPRSWDEAGATLLALANADLDRGGDPLPSLLAFEGDDPLGLVALRPFGPGELLQPLVEVLALLVPLGADRLALLLPARAWSAEDPIVPVTDEGDLRQRVVLLTTADAHGRACRTRTSIHPYDAVGGRTRWGDPLHPAGTPDAPVVSALAALLDERRRLTEDAEDVAVAAQLARVLLLGHELALAPPASARLAAAALR
jgi:hypothetical protein